jgi:Probable Zinc-ribbon domain
MKAPRASRIDTLARIVGRNLSQLARQLERARISNPAERSMRELAAIVLGKGLAQARAETRVRRLGTAASKHWVAGYPRLLAEWHPTKNGDLFPDEVSHGSGKQIWWVCARGPDHVCCAAPHNRTTRSRGCPYCANRMVSVTNSLAALAPEIAREWHPTLNGKLTPMGANAKSHLKVWWQCARNPQHVWQARLANRWWGRSGCPFCSGQRVDTGNCLATQFPEIAAEWDRVRNGNVTPRAVTAKSHARVWWRCPRDRTHRWQAAVDDRTIHGSGCPVCMGKAPVPPGARKGRLNSFAERFPQLAVTWDRKRNLPTRPKDVSYGSHFRAWWMCERDPAHRWRAQVNERSRGSGCPVCAGKAAAPPGNERQAAERAG